MGKRPTKTQRALANQNRMEAHGKRMAIAIKKCKGTPNNKGQFYACIRREIKLAFQK